MEKITKTLTVKEFMAKYAENQNLFDLIPEFGFLKPVSGKAFAKKCTCGMNQEIARATAVFNDFVVDLALDTVIRTKSAFDIKSELCFGVLASNGEFAVKCYA